MTSIIPLMSLISYMLVCHYLQEWNLCIHKIISLIHFCSHCLRLESKVMFEFYFPMQCVRKCFSCFRDKQYNVWHALADSSQTWFPPYFRHNARDQQALMNNHLKHLSVLFTFYERQVWNRKVKNEKINSAFSTHETVVTFFLKYNNNFQICAGKKKKKWIERISRTGSTQAVKFYIGAFN